MLFFAHFFAFIFISNANKSIINQLFTTIFNININKTRRSEAKPLGLGPIFIYTNTIQQKLTQHQQQRYREVSLEWRNVYICISLAHTFSLKYEWKLNEILDHLLDRLTWSATCAKSFAIVLLTLMSSKQTITLSSTNI